MTKENQLINISRGPQFKTKGVAILAVLSLTSLILSISSLFNADFLLAFILLIISITIFSIVLDIHGIEVDKNEHKIREYKIILGFRIGKWECINDFNSIYLAQENVNVRTSDHSEQVSETYHYYFIKLVDELNKKEILLAEYKNYYKALKIAKNVAISTGLKFRSFLKGPIKRKV